MDKHPLSAEGGNAALARDVCGPDNVCVRVVRLVRAILFKAATAAAMLAMAGCDNISIGGGGSGGSADSAAPQVSAEELRAAVSDERVRRFYEARQWRAAWNGQQEQALVAGLRDSARHGLDPRRYLGEVNGASAGAAREAALSKAALVYADTLARGQTDPVRLHEVYEIPRPEADVAAGLARTDRKSVV